MKKFLGYPETILLVGALVVGIISRFIWPTFSALSGWITLVLQPVWSVVVLIGSPCLFVIALFALLFATIANATGWSAATDSVDASAGKINSRKLQQFEEVRQWYGGRMVLLFVIVGFLLIVWLLVGTKRIFTDPDIVWFRAMIFLLSLFYGGTITWQGLWSFVDMLDNYKTRRNDSFQPGQEGVYETENQILRMFSAPEYRGVDAPNNGISVRQWIYILAGGGLIATILWNGGWNFLVGLTGYNPYAK